MLTGSHTTLPFEKLYIGCLAIKMAMESETRRFNIVVRNHVQLIGFRGVVESIAKEFGLKGYVFNDKDGSVKIVCEGVIAAVENFINDLRRLSGSLDVKIEKEEISDKAYLPDEFGRFVVADELSLRLDRGIELLEEIKKDTSQLSQLSSMNEQLSSMNKQVSQLSSMNKQLSSMNETLGEMKNLLQRIAEK